MKKIMILGVGIYQVPLIMKAKSMGLYTIVVSIAGDYPGFKYADKVYYANTTDKEGVLEIARAEDIDGICTAGTDVAVITIGYVCEKLGLKGISYQSSQIVTDKSLMKKCLFEHSVSTSKFVVAHSEEEAVKAFNELTKDSYCEKVVMKIVDKSGSRGIICVDNAKDVPSIYNIQMNITNKDYIVMEQFVEGVEIGLDGIIQEGQLKVLLPHEKYVYTHDNVGIPIGHIVPYQVDEQIYNNVVEEAKKAIAVTGLDNCCVNMDMFVLKDGSVSIIELGGRSGATGIPEIISRYLDSDYYEMIINNALGVELSSYEDGKSPCVASMLLFSRKNGKLVDIYVPDIDNMTVQYDYNIGHEINAIKDGTDRIGQIVLWSDSYDDIVSKLDTLQKNTVVEVS